MFSKFWLVNRENEASWFNTNMNGKRCPEAFKRQEAMIELRIVPDNKFGLTQLVENNQLPNTGNKWDWHQGQERNTPLAHSIHVCLCWPWGIGNALDQVFLAKGSRHRYWFCIAVCMFSIKNGTKWIIYYPMRLTNYSLWSTLHLNNWCINNLKMNEFHYKLRNNWASNGGLGIWSQFFYENKSFYFKPVKTIHINTYFLW